MGAAVAALPRIAEVISGYAPDERPGALEVAERRFIEAALDYGCTEIAAQSRVSILMKRLRRQVERHLGCQNCHKSNSSMSAFASFKSRVSKPSVNHP